MLQDIHCFYAQAAKISPRKSNNNMSELIAENVNLKLEVEQLQDELVHTKQEILTQELLIRKTLVDNFSDKYQRINDLWGDRLANREKALQVEIEKWKNRYNELLQDYEDLEEEIKSKNDVRYVDSD